MKVDASLLNGKGETPLDLAVKQNHIEIVTYLTRLAMGAVLKNPSKKAAVESRLVHLFKHELKEQVDQVWGNIGMDPASVNIDLFVKQILDNIEPNIQAYTTRISTADKVIDPAIQSDVDDFLQGFIEGLTNAGIKLSEEDRCNLVTNLRPQAEGFVEEIASKRKEIEDFAKAMREEIQQEIKQIETRKENLFKEMQETAQQEAVAAAEEEKAKKERQEKQDGNSLYMGNLGIRSAKHFFVPSYNLDKIEQLKIYIQNFRMILAKEASRRPLPERLKQKAQQILSKISQERAEIKPLYRELKNISVHRGGDLYSWGRVLAQLTFKDQSYWRQEQLYVKGMFGDPVIARKLLDELKALKLEMEKMLAASHENLADYVCEDYESDPENDYSQEELGDYLSSHVITPSANPAVKAMQKAIAGQHQAILKKLGSKEATPVKDLVAILEQSPTLPGYIRMYNISLSGPTLRQYILQAFVSQLKEPYEPYFQDTSLNRIKKNFHRFKIATYQVVKEILAHQKQVKELD